MKSSTSALFAVLLATALLVSASETPTPPQVPKIVKKGVIAADLCETTPLVFKGKVYRLEWHRKASRLRIHDGWFYLFYLEAGKPHGYEQYVTRSRDLIHWTPSPFNPVLAASPEDKLIRNRTDMAQDRASTLRLKVSNDGQQWNDVWQAAGAEPSWEIPLTGKSLKARYVRLETHPKNPMPLHLQHLEVWGK